MADYEGGSPTGDHEKHGPAAPHATPSVVNGARRHRHDSEGTARTKRAHLAILGLTLSEALTRPLRHRGFWRLSRAIGTFSDDEIVVDLGYGRAHVRLNDPYWARVAARRFRYEHEIELWMNRLQGRLTDFIDVGANIGYWSIVYSGMFPESQVTAAEPNPQIFSHLTANAGLNDDRFSCIQTAVTSTPISSVTLHFSESRGGHAGASIDPAQSLSSDATVSVPALTLDSLIESVRRPGIPLLVKLDIEGIESTVLAASKASRDDEIAFIYEDHGRDRDSSATTFLLEQGCHDIYFLSTSGAPLKIIMIEELRRLKRSRKIGYNCVAIPKVGKWQEVR